MNRKKNLKLSYSDPSLWWKRTLNVNSKEWKELRTKILERDDYSCYFCSFKAKKYMIIDHINGNATDNRKENLRVNCPMCDTIRHCGLAGIKKTIKLKKSNISQVEIIIKTREFYIKNKRCPLPEEIDPLCSETILLPIDVAVKEEEEIPEEWKKYKGFFTDNFVFKFLN